MEKVSVTSSDGVEIATYEAGNPDGPEVLFLHGICQSHLAWRAQLTDKALTSQLRMVAIDLRGHGLSGKPAGKASYEDPRWAGDIAAVIAAKNLRRPVVVAWSYAGRVITDYLRAHGDSALAGINFVAAMAKTDPATLGPKRVHLLNMVAEDLDENIAATRGFVRACFEAQPSQQDYETILAYNMMVPRDIRAHLLARTANPGDIIATLTVPVLASHGAQDAIILPNMSEFIVAQAKHATLSLYPGAGHTPFAEAAPRFNRELAEFVKACAA